MSDLTATFLTGSAEQGGTRLITASTIITGARALVTDTIGADQLRAPEDVDVEAWMAGVIALVAVIGAAQLDPAVLDELETGMMTAAEALALMPDGAGDG